MSVGPASNVIFSKICLYAGEILARGERNATASCNVYKLTIYKKQMVRWTYFRNRAKVGNFVLPFQVVTFRCRYNIAKLFWCVVSWVECTELQLKQGIWNRELKCFHFICYYRKPNFEGIQWGRRKLNPTSRTLEGWFLQVELVLEQEHCHWRREMDIMHSPADAISPFSTTDVTDATTTENGRRVRAGAKTQPVLATGLPWLQWRPRLRLRRGQGPTPTYVGRIAIRSQCPCPGRTSLNRFYNSIILPIYFISLN